MTLFFFRDSTPALWLRILIFGCRAVLGAGQALPRMSTASAALDITPRSTSPDRSPRHFVGRSNYWATLTHRQTVTVADDLRIT